MKPKSKAPTPELPPLALYIHIPWCVKKCPYCDFNSHTSNVIPEQAYIEALLEDLRQDAHFAQGRSISTIFFGGGTPSIFSANAIADILKGVEAIVPIAQGAEITLEANPGTFEQEKFNGFYDAGINRLSIGIQSFNDSKLKALGRIHGSEEALRAVAVAKAAGFNNINLDLMFGLPNQTLEDALQDLQTAIKLEPTHLSWYQLTIEPNTIFYTKTPVLPEDDEIWTIQEQGQQLLQSHGFSQYEISAYATPGKQCAHNLNYWQFGDYLAIGAGAHGKSTCLESGAIKRWRKTRLPKDYLDNTKAYTSELNTLLENDAIFEFFLNGLRLNQGVDLNQFESRTSASLASIQAPINTAIDKGLMTLLNDQAIPTAQGLRYLNDLQGIFLPD